ncbi:MAG TPA: hypothetical protein DEO86_06155 [Colwellia sp.]|nr:hypothetical protein [Colwellia sp.]|tara:strand:+ start:900 stop:1283 length:384 start_codon:yes stop_codon:yes gene_type:complete
MERAVCFKFIDQIKGSGMTGQSSRGSSGVGGGSVPEDYCSTFSFEAIVNSPDPDVVQRLQVHDPLQVELVQSQGTEVVALLHNADILGGLVNMGGRLKQCIESGYEFQGIVRTIDQGLVRVFIEPKD